MKFLAVFAAFVAIAAAAPTTSWTLHDLTQAIENPATPASVLPYLEHALNVMMEHIFAGQPINSIAVPTPAGLLPVEALAPAIVMPAEVDLAPTPTTAWTLHDLSQAIENPATPAALLPYIEHALDEMMAAIFAGKPMDTITIMTPAGLLPVEAVSPVVVMPVEVDPTLTTAWTLNDLSLAIQNPATPAELLPYLEHALDELMAAIFAGQPINTITVPTPAGLLPVEAISPVVVMPVEVDPTPIAPIDPTPVPAPIVPAPVAEASSPLVQIIINIKSQESAVIPEVPRPTPTPVVIVPEPVEIGPAPGPVVIIPEPVAVVPEVPAPIVIGPAPVEINPIDVIAIGAPDFNPIDLLHPVPVHA